MTLKEITRVRRVVARVMTGSILTTRLRQMEEGRVALDLESSTGPGMEGWKE